jgi:hypothetical protein
MVDLIILIVASLPLRHGAGAAECGEHRQAAGASAEAVTRVPPNTSLA